MPGLGCGSSIYADLIDALKEAYTLYPLTVAGFNGTPPVSSPVIPTVLSSLAALIKKEGLSRPVLVGHSIGGTICLKFASLNPDRLAAPSVGS